MDMFLEYVWAFPIGGAFCAVGQLLIDLTKLTPARILGVREAVDQHGLLGAFMGGFTAAAAGIAAAVFFGLLAALCFKSGSKINET